MNNYMKFGNWEAVALLITLMNTQIILGFPRVMIETAGTAGWMVVIYVSIIAFILFTIIAKLYAPFENMDILTVAEYAAGTPGRIIIGSIYVFYIIAFIAIVLREFGEDLKVIGFRNSPISFLMLFLLTGMIIGCYVGLESLVRYASITVPFMLIGFLLITFGVAPYYEFENFLPILGDGLFHIFGHGFLKLSIFSALSILFLIVPFLHGYKNFKFIGYTSLGLAALLFFWGVFTFILTFPYPAALEAYLPVYHMATLINYGRFFQRIESVFLLIWMNAALIYLSSGLFFAVYVFRETYKLKYYKPLIFPFAIIIFTLSLLPPNLLAAVEIETRYFRNYIWAITFVMPIMVLLIARFKKSREVKPKNE